MNTGAVGSASDLAAEAQMQMFGYAAALAARKRAEPGEDTASSLLSAEVDGERLTDMEFNVFFLLLINAGGDTTRNLIAAGKFTLMDHPSDRDRLVAEPALMPLSIQEMLRYVTPVNMFARTATKDTELHGVAVRNGDRAVMFYPSANRDEAQFDDPDRFDITRDPNPHLSFGGGGTHFCLGANLARVEAAAIFPEILTRLPDLELASMPVRFAGVRTPAR